MANKHLPDPANQHFPPTELLFRRVRRENVRRGGKATFLAFALPDMSVNRGRDGAAEDARKGFSPIDWAVASFDVAAIPPRSDWFHLVQVYQLCARHVPEPNNHSHSEVRVWRHIEECWTLITARSGEEFLESDPDRESPRNTPEVLLDPDFHMRWRKHIALAAKMALGCVPESS
jgi:hypothetical protein